MKAKLALALNFKHIYKTCTRAGPCRELCPLHQQVFSHIRVSHKTFNLETISQAHDKTAIMPPSGTEAAKEKFNAAVDQTRAAAPGADKPGASDRNAGDNPKLGAFVSGGLAKGDTDASRYTAQGAGGHEKPWQK